MTEQLSFKLEVGKPRLTAARARELLTYDPETGVLRWRVRPSQNVKAGTVAGGSKADGRNVYWCVTVDDSRYYAHRLAYLLYYGAWPTGEIDHINGNGLDNRISNLRAVTRTGNRRNLPRYLNNTSGVTGVVWNKETSKWLAQIRVSGRNVHLGYFNTIAEAARARREADRRFDYHENHGRAA